MWSMNDLEYVRTSPKTDGAILVSPATEKLFRDHIGKHYVWDVESGRMELVAKVN